MDNLMDRLILRGRTSPNEAFALLQRADTHVWSLAGILNRDGNAVHFGGYFIPSPEGSLTITGEITDAHGRSTIHGELTLGISLTFDRTATNTQEVTTYSLGNAGKDVYAGSCIDGTTAYDVVCVISDVSEIARSRPRT